jgi:ectoine hydroxylase-related dioxygenase (phytanoyl-CoA dioxygenase family)
MDEELEEQGYCILRGRLERPLLDACRDALWPVLGTYLEHHGHEPNRGAHRHFLPMPFTPPFFAPDFFFDREVLAVVRSALGERIVADQWGCDVPLEGSDYQGIHADYQRPLFEESPDLPLPSYMLNVSFGLVPVTLENGPLEIAPRTHRIPRTEALRAVNAGEIAMRPVPLAMGDVLVRHPWALHRGTPNTTDTPRPLVTIRYVRRWYADSSRDVESVPRAVWESLTAEQRSMMRFPIAQ